MDLIQFVRVAGRWLPTGRGGSTRGAAIIKLLGLAGPEHLDRYESFVNEYIADDLAAVRQAIARDDANAAAAAWALALRHVRPQRAWAALAYDVLDFFFPEAERASLNLHLPRP
jgi:hypothetical protein